MKKEPNTLKSMSKSFSSENCGDTLLIGGLLIPCEHYAPMTMIRLICLFVLT